jgi:hypothetical protein
MAIRGLNGGLFEFFTGGYPSQNLLWEKSTQKTKCQMSIPE